MVAAVVGVVLVRASDDGGSGADVAAVGDAPAVLTVIDDRIEVRTGGEDFRQRQSCAPQRPMGGADRFQFSRDPAMMPHWKQRMTSLR